MTEAVASPGLFADGGRQSGLDRINAQQLSIAVVAGCIERGHVNAGDLSQMTQTRSTRFASDLLQGIDEGWQQVFAVSQQHHIKKGGEWFGIGGEHRPTSEHDWVIIRSLITPDRNPLLFQKIQQHGPIELPAQGETEQLTAAVLWIALVGEQATHV